MNLEEVCSPCLGQSQEMEEVREKRQVGQESASFKVDQKLFDELLGMLGKKRESRQETGLEDPSISKGRGISRQGGRLSLPRAVSRERTGAESLSLERLSQTLEGEEPECFPVSGPWRSRQVKPLRNLGEDRWDKEAQEEDPKSKPFFWSDHIERDGFQFLEEEEEVANEKRRQLEKVRQRSCLPEYCTNVQKEGSPLITHPYQELLAVYFSGLAARSMMKGKKGACKEAFPVAYNFVKNCLIYRYLKNRRMIMDLGCGPGQDVRKWQSLRPSPMVIMADLSRDCLLEAERRWNIEGGTYPVTFWQVNFVEPNLGRDLPNDTLHFMKKEPPLEPQKREAASEKRRGNQRESLPNRDGYHPKRLVGIEDVPASELQVDAITAHLSAGMAGRSRDNLSQFFLNCLSLLKPGGILLVTVVSSTELLSQKAEPSPFSCEIPLEEREIDRLFPLVSVEEALAKPSIVPFRRSEHLHGTHLEFAYDPHFLLDFGVRQGFRNLTFRSHADIYLEGLHDHRKKNLRERMKIGNDQPSTPLLKSLDLLRTFIFQKP